MDPKLTAWLIVILGYLLPLAHVVLSPRAGSWGPPPGSGCPLSSVDGVTWSFIGVESRGIVSTVQHRRP